MDKEYREGLGREERKETRKGYVYRVTRGAIRMAYAAVRRRYCVLALLLLFGGVMLRAQADDPVPWELGGSDDYYIARGWTIGYSSQPLRIEPSVRAAANLNHTVHLPAMLAGPAEREVRALWVTRWDWQTPADIQRIVDKVAYAHFNTILFQVRGQADALYRSNLEPWSARLGRLGQDPGWDPLAEMLTRAHAAGLEVHAWVNVYPAWLGTQDPATLPPTDTVPLHMYHDFNQRYGNEWVQWTQAGNPMQFPPAGATASYLCASPANPNVADHIVAVCRDLLQQYPVDGLHLDYIRYADRIYSYDPVSQQEYARALAAEPGLARAEWQRRQITALVARLRQEALLLRPGARLSIAAWPVYQDRWGWFTYSGYSYDGYNAYCQDSQGWARSGLVSGIMPMLYSVSIHDDRERFETLARDFVNGSQPGGVVIGIGGDYGPCASNPEQPGSFLDIEGRIAVARSLGARGQSIFSYRTLDERNYWTNLREGPYRRIAVPNWP